MKATELGTSTSAAAGAAVEMGTTPFPIGSNAVLMLHSKGGAFAGTAKVQTSDDNSTWADVSGSTVTTAGTTLVNVVVAKYMRINCTAFTSGSATATMLG